LLFVLAMVGGDRARRGARIDPNSGSWTAAAFAVILFSLVIRKADLLFPQGLRPGFWTSFEQSYSWLFTKTNLGPLRLLHFAALTRLISRFLPRDDSAWQHPLAVPLGACGRHSLTVYCVGTVLAYSCGYLIEQFGAATWTVTAIALDACVMQFLIALWLDRRVQQAPPRLATLSASGAVEPAQST